MHFSVTGPLFSTACNTKREERKYHAKIIFRAPSEYMHWFIESKIKIKIEKKKESYKNT
jgi:hypothetical protein